MSDIIPNNTMITIPKARSSDRRNMNILILFSITVEPFCITTKTMPQAIYGQPLVKTIYPIKARTTRKQPQLLKLLPNRIERGFNRLKGNISFCNHTLRALIFI